MRLAFILDELFAQYPFLLTLIWVLTIFAAAILAERVVSRWVGRFIEKSDLPPHTGNALLLTGRFIIFVGALMAVLGVGGVSPDILVAFSALSGAAIGFASSQTIGNVLAGLYVLVSRPFRAGDYVKLDGVEGIVKELSINYTKILTPTNNIVFMSNRRVLDRDIVNFRYTQEKSNLYRYGIELSFDNTLPTEKTEKIEAILERVAENYAERLPKKPEYQLTKLSRLDRNYMFFIHVEDPKDVFILYSRVLREITTLWDEARR
jgi:small conductance mechanosensitive channel